MEKNNSLVKAINKNVRTSPRKLALVCNFIKGKEADVALRDLEFSRKRISKDVSNLSKTNKKKLKLVWVNNKIIIDQIQNNMSVSRSNFIKKKKIFIAYKEN